MNKENLYLQEAQDYLSLSKTYFDIAQCRGNKKEHWRGVVDANYNSAELCIKGLLRLKMIEIPSTHSGVVQKFGQLYVKTNIIPREFGRILNKSLRLRNFARYECKAEFDQSSTKELEKLTTSLIKFLEKKIKKYNFQN